MWKIDWDMLEKISPNSKFNRELKGFIGNSLITEVRYYEVVLTDGRAGIANISLEGLNGKIIASDGYNPTVVDNDYASGYVLLSPKESKALIEVKEDTKTGHNVAFYMFLGDQYDSLDEVIKAIEDYSETDGAEQAYYYEHHNVVEYSYKIEASEKLVGQFDQETLDKVNEILKMKGVDFTIKGDK